MAEKTNIPWTDSSWNPWVGCRKVSPGCQKCYMYRDQSKRKIDPSEIRRTLPATFRKPLNLPPGRIFTCSYSDFFVPEADEWRRDAWNIIYDTPQQIYQILTKRPCNILDRLPADWGEGYYHVWLGVTVENDAERDRIKYLMNVPASLRFVSIEPLLGPVDIVPYLRNTVPPEHDGATGYMTEGIDWVIVGAESGPGRRPCNIEWVREIVKQCKKHNTPVFVKQLDIDGKLSKDINEWPEDLRVQEMPR